jgi:hypothetical protein
MTLGGARESGAGRERMTPGKEMEEGAGREENARERGMRREMLAREKHWLQREYNVACIASIACNGLNHGVILSLPPCAAGHSSTTLQCNFAM